MLSVGSVGPTVALAADPVDSPINTFWGYAGSSREADTVANLLDSGATDGAQAFAAAIAGSVEPSVETVITQALADAAAGDPSGAAGELRNFLVPAGVPSVGGGSGLPPIVNSSIDATTSSNRRAPQSSRGESLAYAPANWRLHGQDYTAIYFGDCNGSGCKTDGYVNEDFSATLHGLTTDSNETIYQGGGESPGITNHKMRLYQDIVNKTDPLIYGYYCTGAYCSGSGSVPSAAGRWYYVQVDYHLSYASGSTDVKIQTRRWLVNSNGSSSTFDAYRYGG